MDTTTSDLTAALLPLFPDFGSEGRHLVPVLFRLLGRGYPVDAEELADRAEWAAEAVRRLLDGWRGVRYDEDGRIIGFWGLDLFPTRHHLRVGERDLFAWGAWDPLVLPFLLEEEVALTSRCFATDDDILLRVAPQGVLDSEPEDVRLAFRVPETEAVRYGVRAAFNQHIGFLAGPEPEAGWRDLPPGTQVLSLEEGFRLGQAVWTHLLDGEP
ncbi:organomercurial lyase [Thiohalorhabdus sp. Cl-TMA]|uniref:Alkylmercury lyase n=1 Tax=Thiohalorhabdus methylotrophus TaxID=3242694 RepID=A0ABV4TVF7_9GAMM